MGVLSLRGDLGNLRGRQGICTCEWASSGCQHDPFLSVRGQWGGRLAPPAAFGPSSQLSPQEPFSALEILSGPLLLWEVQGHLAFSPSGSAPAASTMTRMVPGPCRLPLQLQCLSRAWWSQS